MSDDPVNAGTPTFGVHTGPSNTTVADLRSLWARIEEGPFDWISIWDHFLAADGTSTQNLEAVALHAALAVTTSRVRCGSLVYCAAYRHPAVLANAMATIDHLSGGRCDFGIGAGWARDEFDAHGIEFRSTRERLDVMEESLRCVRGLLREERFDFEGSWFTMNDAVCDPKPLQPALPLWVGGGGERRTLRIAAELADGWNVPFVSPETFAHKRTVLAEHCRRFGRDVGEIRCAVNVGCAPDDESLHRQFGLTAEFVRPGTLMGSTAEIVDGLGRYLEAGADQVNLAMRAPFELAALEAIADAVESL
ncbi:MAG TPA: LLM class flavin-dependent oxidoreductase [Microthrixaceae bacterium]|nr:LLM class flavin-dependent oxidoreductase [Microthrixaceae bacterium]